MAGKLFKSILGFCIAILLPSLASAQVSGDSTISFELYFPVASSELDENFASNSLNIERFMNAYNKVQEDRFKTVYSITYIASTSPEGQGRYNDRLARARQRAAQQWINKNIIPNPIPTETDTKIITNRWRGILTLAKKDPRLIQKDKSIRLIKAAVENPSKTKKIKEFLDGQLWDYMTEEYFPSQRYCKVVMTIRNSDPVAQKGSGSESSAIPETKVTLLQESEPAAFRDIYKPVPVRSIVRLGTNLAYDALTVANLSLEVGFARHFSLGIRTTFSPWDIQPTLKFRTLLLEPEFRWYPGKDFKGHHIGLQGYYGWYNIAPFNSKVRYQDKDGSTPLYGGGLTYGYNLAIGKHFGFDFTIGVGYAYLNYDCFYNVVNGDKFNTAEKHWFGPTELGITFYYQF